MIYAALGAVVAVVLVAVAARQIPDLFDKAVALIRK